VAIVDLERGSRRDTQAGSVVLWDLQKGKAQQTLEEFDKFDKDTLQFWHVTSSKDGTTSPPRPQQTTKIWSDQGVEAKTGKVLQTFVIL